MATFETATAFTDNNSTWIAANYSYSSDIIRRIYLNQDYIYAAVTGRSLTGAANGSVTKHAHTGAASSDGQALLGIAYNQQIMFNAAYNGGFILGSAVAVTLAGGVVQGGTSGVDARVWCPSGVNRLGMFAFLRWTDGATGDPYFRFDIGGTYVEKQISAVAAHNSGEWIHVTSSSMLTATANSWNDCKFYYRNTNNNSCTVRLYGAIIYYDTTLK